MINTKKYGDYKIIKKLGEGGFGNIFLGQKEENMFALKFIDKDLIIEEDLAQNIKTELSLMKTIQHPNIVKIYEILSSAQKIIIVMEYIEGGDLFDKIKEAKDEKVTENEARKYFQQMIYALEYCHYKKIIHRDLKPENILFDKNNDCIKIADFGLATILKEKDEKLSDLCGTINYIAPEIIKQTGKIFSSGGYNGQPADIWSAGVILYNMVSGENPFYHQDKAVSINNIINGNVDYPNYFSEALVDFLSHILNPQPKSRFTIADIKKHQWFKKNLLTPIIISQQPTKEIKNEVKTSPTFKISSEWNNIPIMNCFVLSSMITGKWVKTIFNIGLKELKELEPKENYEYYGEIKIEQFEEIINTFFSSIDSNVRYVSSQSDIVTIQINQGQSDVIELELLVFKVSQTKLLFSFSFKEGLKIGFIRTMTMFYEKIKKIINLL